mmetsp:Transcript_56769/g.127608  ORF Transcript_56769/g.127608 Transcript_56769/m.127608 type:complete len:305 (+) Transcript_56769:76-990(+)
MSTEDSELTRVEVDTLVILQIMKHCRQHAPQTVAGLLLGLDVQSILQVTHCFGYMQKGGEDYDSSADDGQQYQLEMLKKLREVNVDSNTVGWYQTTQLGQLYSEKVIETQYQYQVMIPRSVLLVYDPLQSSIGKCAFKAIQLSPQFMRKYEAQEANRSVLNDFTSGEMFVEIPIVLTSPLISDAFLIDWALADPVATTSQIDVLDVENQALSEKNAQLLVNSLQELADEQRKIQDYERQTMRGEKGEKGKGKGRYVQQPRHLDTMILSKQIHNYCKQINNVAADTFGKTYLLSNKPSSSRGSMV